MTTISVPNFINSIILEERSESRLIWKSHKHNSYPSGNASKQSKRREVLTSTPFDLYPSQLFSMNLVAEAASGPYISFENHKALYQCFMRMQRSRFNDWSLNEFRLMISHFLAAHGLLFSFCPVQKLSSVRTILLNAWTIIFLVYYVWKYWFLRICNFFALCFLLLYRLSWNYLLWKLY